MAAPMGNRFNLVLHKHFGANSSWLYFSHLDRQVAQTCLPAGSLAASKRYETALEGIVSAWVRVLNEQLFSRGLFE
jgi:hypothetical protein